MLHKHQKLQRVFTFIPVLLIHAGCVSTNVEGTMLTQKNTIEQGKVTVLSQSIAAGNETEKKFTKCVIKKIKAMLPQDSYLDNQEFINAMYPWFEPERFPSDIVQLRSILEKPLITEKINSLHVRYMVLLTGNTVDVNKKECGACSVAPLLVGMPGLATFDKQASYVIEIWDLKKQEAIVDLNVGGTSTIYMPILPIVALPIPMGGDIQEASCKELGKQMQKFFTDA